MSGATKVLQADGLSSALKMLEADEGAMCLSGGATLVAMLNAKLIEPSALVSLKLISKLAGITRAANGTIVIGAMTRHAMSASSDFLVGSNSGVREAASKIANPTVRNMGTMGGSISFADPGADYPPALVAANAEIEIVSPAGSKRIEASEFFVDWYETILQPGEIVSAIHLPAADPEGTGVHEKFARVEGDFATVSVNVVLALDGDICSSIRIAVGACGPTPVRSSEVEASLIGNSLSKTALIKAGEQLAAACDPIDDQRGSAEYRLHLVPQLVARAVFRAVHELEKRTTS